MSVSYEHHHEFTTGDDGRYGATMAAKKAVEGLLKAPGYYKSDEWNGAVYDILEAIAALSTDDVK